MSATAVLFVLVCGIGTLNSVFLAVHLWFRPKGRSDLNRLLAALLFAFSIRVSKAVVVFFVSGVHAAFELAWVGVLGVTGPLALAYLCRLADVGPRTIRLVLWACALGSLAGFLMAPFLPLAAGWKLLTGALSIYGASLAFAVPALLRGGRQDHPRDRLAARWAWAVGGFLAVVWGIHVSLLASRLRGPVREEAFFDVEAVLFSLAVYALVHAELKWGLLGRVHQLGAAERIAADDPALKRLRQLVEDDRLYLDPSLSIAALARALRLTPQHVSRLVNSGLGVGFTDYVNRLRVDEVRRRLSEPGGASLKIGQLGFDCGFNSASVFYAAFRKFVGKTPSEYLKEAGPG